MKKAPKKTTYETRDPRLGGSKFKGNTEGKGVIRLKGEASRSSSGSETASDTLMRVVELVSYEARNGSDDGALWACLAGLEMSNGPSKGHPRTVDVNALVQEGLSAEEIFQRMRQAYTRQVNGYRPRGGSL